jgi:iron complex outermembrane receptor protein
MSSAGWFTLGTLLWVTTSGAALAAPAGDAPPATGRPVRAAPVGPSATELPPELATPPEGEPPPAALIPSTPSSLPPPAGTATPAAGVAPIEPSAGGELALFALELKLHQVVSVASKIELSIEEAPSIVSLVTRDSMLDYGWTSLNEVLYRQPGFAPSQDYDRRTVTARGFYEGWNNNHLLMLFDGVPYNDNQYGTAYTFEATPLFLLKSLEVVRGPGSALYGSSAINGVLSLKSLAARDLEVPAVGLVRFGSFNTQIYDIIVGKEFRYFSFVAAYNRHTTEGAPYLSYDGSGRVDAAGTLQQFTVKTRRNSHYGFLKVDGEGPLRGLSLQFHYSRFQNETGHGWLWYISDDSAEIVTEDRQILSLHYTRPALGGKLLQDYVIRYQRHGIDYPLKFYPNGTQIGSGASAVGYPDGLFEHVVTATHDIFLRAQLGWNIRPGMSLIGGIENTLFLYLGDSLHQSNVDLTTTFQPWNPPGVRDLGPWMEWIRNHPVNNTGAYVQYISGRVLNRKLAVTLGLRFDVETFTYDDIADPARATGQKVYYAVSPRVALLIFPHRMVTIKLLFDRAFRAPAPAELFGANTYTLGSNLQNLAPELVTTGQVGLDLNPLPQVTVRINGFYEYLENLIGYSPTSNLLANLYTRGIAGLEAETLGHAKARKVGEFDGFINYSYAYLAQETIAQGNNLTGQPGVLTWAPAHLLNLGARFSGHGLGLSAQVHYQGPSTRRDSDLATPAYAVLRPATVDGFWTVDARVSYSPTRWLQLGVQANNLLNQTGYLIKPNDFPFDFRVEGIRVLGTIQVQPGPF